MPTEARSWKGHFCLDKRKLPTLPDLGFKLFRVMRSKKGVLKSSIFHCFCLDFGTQAS